MDSKDGIKSCTISPSLGRGGIGIGIKVKCVEDMDDKVLEKEGCIRKRRFSYFQKFLNEGRDTSIMLGNLQYFEMFHIYGYCRRMKV